MGSQGFAAAFSLLSCLAAGALALQGAEACRYRGERSNRVIAGVVIVLAGAALACFAQRLGHWERLFGGFANPLSGISVLLWAFVLFVVVAGVALVLSLRSEDGSVPAWCGAACAVAGFALAACSAFGTYYYLRLTNLTADFFAYAFLCVASAVVLGCLAVLVVAGMSGARETQLTALRVLLVAVPLYTVALAVLLGVLAGDATAAAGRSSYSMTTYNMNGTGTAATSTVAGPVIELVAGEGALWFWLVGVGCSIVAPLAAAVALHVRREVAARYPRFVALVGFVVLALACAGVACVHLCLSGLGI